MEDVKRININDMPKWFLLLINLLPLAFMLTIKSRLDNDFYFLYPTGEYIVNNGFPTTDFLSMHSTMTIVVQQWLSSVIYYFAYRLLGSAGPMLIVYLCYVLFTFLMFRLCDTISGNHFVSGMCAMAADIFIASVFFTTRPQIFTYLIMTAELLELEKYVKTKTVYHLAALPVLSLLLINLHSSMWSMLFIFMLPYLAASIKIDIKKLKLNPEPCCRFLPLFITAIISGLVGFANPYGTKSMLYILSSFGYDEISDNILEMIPPSYANFVGKFLILYLAVIGLIILVYKNKKLNLRFVLLFGGTFLLALVSQKSVAYFLIGGFASLSYILSNFSFTVKITKTTKKDKKVRVVLIALIVILSVLAVVLFANRSMFEVEDEVSESSEAKLTTYEELDEIIDILNSSDEEIVLYGGFNIGQYLEFKGFHPYIDGRAELFLEDNNGEFDYLKEYIDFKNGNIYYTEFLDKYDFNYLVLTCSNEQLLINQMERDGDYEKLYEGDKVMLFHKEG